jgi:hypothetical protein
MSWAIAAISVTDQIEKYGAYAGLAAIVGLAVLSLLYFAQAREVKRLREWAGRAPERAAELEARVAADAARRTTVGAAPQRPQTAAGQAATAAAPATSAVGTPETPKPASPASPPVPGLPVAVPAAAAAATATASAPAATSDAPPATPPGEATPEPPAVPGGGASNGVTHTPPATVGPRVPGRPPPTSTPPLVTPPAATPAGAAPATPDPDPAPAARALRGGPPSRTLPPREESGGGRTPSRRTLGVLGGALAVVAAVVVVLVLTLGGSDTPPPPNQVADTIANTTAAEPGRTQSTRQARVDRADTPVLVLNATGVNGLARQVADRLQSTGYQAAVDNSTSRPQTVIGYKAGAAPAAREIGKLLQVPSAQIQPMPQDLAGQAGNNAVIVVIGADKASD